MQNKNSKGTNFVPVISNWDVDGFYIPSASRASRHRGGQNCRRNAAAPYDAAAAQNTYAVQTGDTCPVNKPCAVETVTAYAAAKTVNKSRGCTACPAPAPAAPVCPAPAPAVPVCPAPAPAVPSCPCGCTANAVPAGAAACQAENDNAAVGMVYAVSETLADVYEPASALRIGTLFPELNKPLNGYYPCGESCATSQQEIAFAAWELRLYLNTHPNDARALALLHRLMAELAEPNYATSFLDAGCAALGWTWVNDPWPWEHEGNCG